MKYFLFVATLLFYYTSIFAQISGSVINAERQPVAFANVILLYAKDSSLVKNILTDTSGNYVFKDIPTGNYHLLISNAGYQTKILPAFYLSADEEKKIDTQILIIQTKELAEVVVHAQKQLFQQKLEGTIVNVENSILSKGSSALQLLERSPGVLINKRDNSIELNGKSGVSIMLNGKLVRMSESQLLDLLAGISADDVSTIELLTSPSAKYDAEGRAGIINIVMKKNQQKGTTASVTATAGYGYKEKAMAGFNIAHNTGNVNLYGSYNFSHNRTYSLLTINSIQDMPFLGGNIHAIGFDTTDLITNSHNVNVGVDAKLNVTTTIGGNIMYVSNATYNNTKSYLGYNILPDSLLTFNGVNSGPGSWNNVVSSMYIEKKLQPDEKISFDASYIHFHKTSDYTAKGSFVNKYGEPADTGRFLSSPQQKGSANTNIHVVATKADYEKQLSKKIKMEVGAKFTFTQSGSASGFQSFIGSEWVSNPQVVNNILMKENIGAAYTSFNIQLFRSTKVTAGLRYEYSNTNMHDAVSGRSIVSRSLGSLFPDIFLSHDLSNTSILQLSYTKRIARPSYNDLASYVVYSDPTAVYTGNPFLQPTITHNIKLAYQYKRYLFAILFSRDINPISRYQLTESPQQDMLLISPQNMLWLNSLMAQVGLPVKINDWFTTNYNFNGGLQQYKLDYTQQPLRHSYFNYSFNYNGMFKLPKQFSAEISGNYNGSIYNGTQKIGGFTTVNLGVKKELRNNNGSFQFSITDVLKGEHYNIHYGLLTQEPFDIRSHVVVYPETSKMPIFKLTYTKSFGTQKAAAIRNNGTNDEQGRIRKD